ncbi:response regulator transcription factor [Pleurocapsales cyanobacterium LEGE 10410]|nr:response regulator transcription factor [Pleurocapsales cyanobacterium LEGE 10410]
MINVLIADDQHLVRKIIESYLEPEPDLNVVGFAENGATAIDRVSSLKPDVVLMDLEMPVMDGLTATKTIAERFTDTKVLMLSIHDRQQDLAQALKLGARGYWLKNTTAQELSNAIRSVHQGYFQLASELIEKHFVKDTVIDAEFQPDIESNERLKIVETVVAEMEKKLELVKELTPQKLNKTIENTVRQEISGQSEQDANLQFRLDRLNHQVNRIKQGTNFALKAQLVCNLILIVAVIALCYAVFWQ